MHNRSRPGVPSSRRCLRRPRGTLPRPGQSSCERTLAEPRCAVQAGFSPARRSRGHGSRPGPVTCRALPSVVLPGPSRRRPGSHRARPPRAGACAGRQHGRRDGGTGARRRRIRRMSEPGGLTFFWDVVGSCGQHKAGELSARTSRSRKRVPGALEAIRRCTYRPRSGLILG
jgi:hypothetical protein